jgi:L-aspartate oxidase
MDTTYLVGVIGVGIAGATVALKLSELRPDIEIVVFSKSTLDQCNSFMAQGGIASEYKTNEMDVEVHIQDTLRAGNYLNDEAAVRWWAHNTEKGIDQLLHWGVTFNSEKALEGGHTTRRIFKVEDQTGRSIMLVLWRELRKRNNIRIIENANVVGVTKSIDGDFFHVRYVFNESNVQEICVSKIVLASGGLGRMVAPSTANALAAAEVMGIAIDLGVKTDFLSCIQFHPTGLYVQHASQTLLISEAVRGEGARLVNCDGEYFMGKYDNRKDLAPRDIVSNSIFKEMERTNSKHVFLDARNITENEWKVKFPFIYAQLREHFIKPECDLIPVYPVSHYLCGGIVTDTRGLTSVDGLYAVGEVACTGIHGSNRLASNSLSEAVVFGLSLAEYLASLSIELNGISDAVISEIQFIAKDENYLSIELNSIAEQLYEVYQYKFGIEKVHALIHVYQNKKNTLNKSSVLYYSLLVVLALLDDYCLRFSDRLEAHLDTELITL